MFPGRSPRPQILIAAGVLLAVVAGAYAVFIHSRHAAPPQVAFSEFMRHVQRGRVAQVTMNEGGLDARLVDGSAVRTVAPPGFLTGNSAFISDLTTRNVRIDVTSVGVSPIDAVPLVLVLTFFASAGFILYRRHSGRIHTVESRARMAERGGTVVTFADVAGVDEAKDEVKEIVDFLREPNKFSAIGGRIPKGVLLVGPPGTGKTLLARSIAGEAGVPFVNASGADFVEMYAGVGASRVRRLFKEARRHKSCIIFIDEIDAVGRSRGSSSLSHEEREQTLNQLLVEMDGFDAHEGIVVIAATNRQDILDPALLRPGRFDRQVVVGRPDVKGREQILTVHAKKVALAPQVEMRSIARGTPGFSGADLANLVNEAALLTARAGRDLVTNADLESARDKVMMGVERRSLVLSDFDRINCAYHEAGHAVVTAVLPMADPLHKVTIIPRGHAMGVTMQLPEADRHTYTGEYLRAQVAILMGGRAAEELFMQHMTSGASNDIERATQIAERMVCEFGMSPLGPLAFRKPSAEQERACVVSEETARRVDQEVRSIVMRGYDLAKQLLETHRPAVSALAEELLDVETLDADEIRALLAANGVGVMPAALVAPHASVGLDSHI